MGLKRLTYEVTSKILQYFRFNRRCFWIATEVGLYNADILLMSRNKFIEIEVKVSYEDFKNDFKKSYKRYGTNKKKHEIYANATSPWVPHYFYYGMPDELIERCLPVLKNTIFGLISVDSLELVPYEREYHCTIVKKAKLLHNKIVDTNNSLLQEAILKRMGSELVTNRQRVLKYRKDI